MATRVFVYTKLELRGVIRFLWAQGKRPAQIHREMSAVYGDDFMSLENVCKWVTQFADNRTSLDESSNSGRPRTSVTPANSVRVETVVQEDRRRTVKSIATTLDMSYGSVYDILHDTLGYRKVAARWVPRSLTEDNKADRMMTCLDHLATYLNDGTTFLDNIVTGDETWVHHFIPESKQASMVWKHPWSPPPKKFKVTQSAGKIMATVFWDYRGVLLVDFNPKGHTINAQTNSETLKRLKLTIKWKRPDRNVGDVILLHDNARPHVARVVSDQIASWGWQVLKHPPYSLNLAPSDYHMFGPLKRGLAGQHFGNDDEVKEAVRQWLRCQPDSFFRLGIENLVVRWDKCLNTLGDYIEK